MTSAERAHDVLLGLCNYDQWYEPHNIEYDVASVAGVIDAAVAEALPRWVPVGERLPTYDEIVLACTSDGEIFMAEWREHDTEPGGAWWSDDDEIVRVVAWQPLPAPWVAL